MEQLIEKVTALRTEKRLYDEGFLKISNERLETVKADLHLQEELLKDVQVLHESNPMIGLRGVRVQIVMEEIPQMQVSAIFQAACNMYKKRIKI